jgi:hypothetical protein
VEGFFCAAVPPRIVDGRQREVAQLDGSDSEQAEESFEKAGELDGRFHFSEAKLSEPLHSGEPHLLSLKDVVRLNRPRFRAPGANQGDPNLAYDRCCPETVARSNLLNVTCDEI